MRWRRQRSNVCGKGADAGMGEVVATVEPLASDLARCRHKLAWTQAELVRERRERAEHLERIRADLIAQIHQVYRAELAALKAKVEAQTEEHRAKVAELKAEFAAKEQAYEAKLRDVVSELAMYKDGGPARSGSEKVDGTDLNSKTKRPRKPRDGHGGGRKIPKNLPTETIKHTLQSSVCPDCGLPLREVAPAVSHEVQFEVRVKLLRHERQKCTACACGWCGATSSLDHGATPEGPACSPAQEPCPEPMSEAAAPEASARRQVDPSAEVVRGAPFLVAPLPPKAMAGSLFSDRSWVEMIVLKYAHQVPLNQIIAIFRSAGFASSSGTICDGFTRFTDRIVDPLERAIITHNLEGSWWAADDSSLRIIEAESERTHGVVWQVRSQDCTVYFFTRTGEAKHIRAYFAGTCPVPVGCRDCSEAEHIQAYLADTCPVPVRCRDCSEAEHIEANFAATTPDKSRTLLADRASTYQTLWFTIAFCWAHMRRDFVRLGRYLPGNRTFAIGWLRHIRRLYRLHRAWRLNPDDPDLHAQLDAQLQRMAEQRDAELQRTNLPEPRRKVLQSLRNHWHGLTRFLGDLRLPLDNNAVERAFRLLARFRHNSQGCHSEGGANTAMCCFTLIATLQQNGISVKPYLLAWCDAVACHGGQPPDDIESWLPWQLADHVKQRIEHFRRF